jgi:Cytochrome P450
MAPTDGSRGETADDETTGADTAGGRDRRTGDTDDVRTDDATGPDSAEPLPPYPSSVGHPITHTLRTMPDVLAFRDAAFATHDVARTYFFGPGDVYNLTHPSHLRRVLVDDRDAFGKTDDFRVAFGDGLVATEGDRWRRQRRALQPFFSRDSLSSYVETMGDQARRRVATWSHGDRIDLQRAMRRMTLDILFATVFGREFALDGDEAIHSAATRLQEWFPPTSASAPTRRNGPTAQTPSPNALRESRLRPPRNSAPTPSARTSWFNWRSNGRDESFATTRTSSCTRCPSESSPGS